MRNNFRPPLVINYFRADKFSRRYDKEFFYHFLSELYILRCTKAYQPNLRKRRTPYRRDDVFDFNEVLKKYIRNVAVDDVVDAPPPTRAIAVSGKDFVTFVVRHLDEAL